MCYKYDCQSSDFQILIRVSYFSKGVFFPQVGKLWNEKQTYPEQLSWTVEAKKASSPAGQMVRKLLWNSALWSRSCREQELESWAANPALPFPVCAAWASQSSQALVLFCGMGKGKHYLVIVTWVPLRCHKCLCLVSIRSNQWTG